MHVLIATEVHPVMLEGFKAMSWQVEYRPGIGQEEFDKLAPQYEGLIVRSRIRVERKILNASQSLKFIGRVGSGLDIIDLEAALQNGVEVFNSPEGNRNAVAEHALAMILAFYNKIPRADRDVRQENWDREANRGEEISDKTIGIIGFGNTGSAFAEKLRGFDARLIAYDPYKEIDRSRWNVHQVASLDTLLSQSEIVSLHVQLTGETRYMVDADFLGKCDPDTLLVNTSRGGVVRTADLLDALEHRRLRGACLDVFENERPSTFSNEEKEMYNRLYALPQVLLSPHVAGWSVQSRRGMTEVLYEKIKARYFSNG